MQLQLIRSATLKLIYGGQTLLIDPDFAPKHSRRPLAGISPNPTAELPIPIAEITKGVEKIIVSHLHLDHFDPVAWENLSKELPLLCQTGDESVIREKGFQNITPLVDEYVWDNLKVTRVGGHHGLGEVEEIMGQVMGFFLQAEGEPSIYWAGDTVLCDEVRSAITRFQPDIIVTHSCGAKWSIASGERVLIVMDALQTIQVCQLASKSIVIATHMEAFDHSTTTRADLRTHAEKMRITVEQLYIPLNGEMLNLF